MKPLHAAVAALLLLTACKRETPHDEQAHGHDEPPPRQVPNTTTMASPTSASRRRC